MLNLVNHHILDKNQLHPEMASTTGKKLTVVIGQTNSNILCNIILTCTSNETFPSLSWSKTLNT